MNNKNNFDKYANNYSELLAQDTSFFSKNDQYFASYKVDLLRKQVSKPVELILEYGCGIGRNIKYLQQAFKNAKIIGSDISTTSLEIARINNKESEFYHESELRNILFDLVFVAGVFHHIPVLDRVRVAQSLYNRLSPGGMIYIFEHNPYNFVTRKIVNNCPYDEGVTLIKPSEMRQILMDASFVVKKMEYCLFIPPALSSLSRVENWLSWLPVGGQYWIHAERPL